MREGVGSLASQVERLEQPEGGSHVLLADLRTQLLLLLDDRTHLLGWSRLTTKGLLGRRRRNILLQRRVVTPTITRVTPTSVGRRSRRSRLVLGHVEK